jgi:hypothetical protein
VITVGDNDNDRAHVGARIPRELHVAAQHRMVDVGVNWQQLFEAAVEAFVAGEWTPTVKD